MANIATVQVAAFVKPGVPRGRVTAHGLVRALTHYGRTYCVPVWTYDDYPRRCVYVQYGAKWSPTGVNDTWARYHAALDAFWVRWYDDGGDFDTIFRHDRGSGGMCRYGFDSVRVVLAPDADPRALGPRWKEVRPGVWETPLNGSYLAGNDRCGLLADDYPSHLTPTTLTRGRWCARDHFVWSRSVGELPAEVEALAPLFSAVAVGVELLWRGRATQIYRPHGDRWWGWHLDDWDNCVDPAWLAYRAARENGTAP